MPNRAAYWRAKVAAEHGGVEPPVIERARNGIKFDLGNGQHRLIRSIGPIHTLAGEEIDTDLEPGQGLYHSQTKAGRLDFDAKFHPNGSRLLTPRLGHPDETVELGRCERWTGHQWVPLPATPPVRSEHQLTFDHGPVGRVRISVKPTFVAYEIIVGNEGQNSGWRWPVTLSNLTWLQEAGSARLVDPAGVTAMFVSAPYWTDSSSPPAKLGPVDWSYLGGYLTHAVAVLPADVVFPVVVR